ncbi:hypothetical protein [Luteibacter yeojuensis]|uniref:Uncharacterized protein n=1 Tax=Luteibacter yeojuensis TaxID=345309 RepID=A0A7X5QU22_9GAMM|nr:hypothetical protein [Luteibacter yeojuensis]NID15427.1 hypothetical protein [Luteibacter yeojuensis]
MGAADITAQLEAALLKAFPIPEYATFFEVGDATGGRHSRWADAVSMACWPSRGLIVTGFELKASRSDWLREKKSPTKSSAIQKYCDKWVLVTAPGVLLDGELPETWGHMELSGSRLVTKVKAPVLTPEPLDRPFLAALLRRAGQASEALISTRVAEATEEARKRANERAEQEIKRRTEDRAVAVAAIEEFEKASGIRIQSYQAEEIGRAVAALMRLRSSAEGWNGLTKIADNLAQLAESARTVHAELDAIGATENTEA